MIDLKRKICGVSVHADTDDPDKAERVKRALDQAMSLLAREKATPVRSRKLIDVLMRGGPIR